MTTDVADKSETFSDALKTWRAAQPGNWTQEKAARVLGVELGTYRNWEQGKNKPASYSLRLIRQAISKTK